MKTYHWTITSSGFIEAHSVKEAEELLKENAIGYLIDDEKYWQFEVEDETVEEVLDKQTLWDVADEEEQYLKFQVACNTNNQ